jgi:hypothetical protein
MIQKVWSYWEGPKPPYIDLCIRTMQKYCSGFTLLTKETLDEYIPNGTLIDDWRRLVPSPDMASDPIRAAILSTHGGFWFDADTIALKDPSESVDGNEDLAYVQWTNPPTRIPAGYIYAKPGSVITRRWLENVNHVMKHQPSRISWCVLGEECLTEAINSPAKGTVWTRHLPLNTFLPIDIDANVALFFGEGNWQSYVKENTVCFGLNHSWFVSRKPHEILQSIESMENSPLLVHQLLASTYHDIYGYTNEQNKSHSLLPNF